MKTLFIKTEMYINCKFVDDSKLKANILIQQRINCLSWNRNSNSKKKKDSLLYIQDGSVFLVVDWPYIVSLINS